MTKHAPVRRRRWQATLIITLFLVAVAGAAAVGWWYARESPPHQGPIVIVSVDGMSAASLPTYGGTRPGTQAIQALAADSVVFERAYGHAAALLPAEASLLSGQLPFEHGVRDDTGFTLPSATKTLAELLRGRGFVTGAAFSSFLLRRETGIAQGFSFFDAELSPADGGTAVERPGSKTVDAAERWARSVSGQRYLLFVQVRDRDANDAVARLTALLKEKRLYDKATILFTATRGATAGGALDDAMLRVPLIVKQPASEGAGRRIPSPVQQVDLLPTLLDLVRAPFPGGLSGRSLRPILDGAPAIAPQPLYAESLIAYFQFGGAPLYAVTGDQQRLIRDTADHLVTLDAAPAATGLTAAALRAALDRLVTDHPITAPTPTAAADEERLARAGRLAGMSPVPAADGPIPTTAILDAYRRAAAFVGDRRYADAQAVLESAVGAAPNLPMLHYTRGALAARIGRVDEAIAALQAADTLAPTAPDIPLLWADVLWRAGRLDDAQVQVDVAIARAETHTPAMRATTRILAARLALQRQDSVAATAHADAAEAADPSRPITDLVKGHLLEAAGQRDEAIAAFAAGIARLEEHGTALQDLYLLQGESLTRAARYAEADAALRSELAAFPHSVPAYLALATMYRLSERPEAVDVVLRELINAVPTPAGYAAVAKFWTGVGDRKRADSVKADARTRFKGDPALGLFGRDGRR